MFDILIESEVIEGILDSRIADHPPRIQLMEICYVL